MILIAHIAAGTETLVLYLPFDEGTDAVANDLSGKNNNGTIVGARWVDGKIKSGIGAKC